MSLLSRRPRRTISALLAQMANRPSFSRTIRASVSANRCYRSTCVQYRHELIRILAGDFYQRRALLSPRWRLQLAYGCLLGFSNWAFAWAAAMTRLRPCPTSRPCIGQSAALTVRVARKLLFLLDAA